MNDSFRSVVFVKHSPETIACACIFLAARKLQIPLPNSPPWYFIFKVSKEEIDDICVHILRLYNRKKVRSATSDLCGDFIVFVFTAEWG
jgi:hypothetical protein